MRKLRKLLFFSIAAFVFASTLTYGQVFSLYPPDALVVQHGLIQFNSCVTGLPGCYYGYHPYGYGYGHRRQPVTKKERVLRILMVGGAGAGSGYAITGTGQGAARGAGAGTAVGLIGEVFGSYFGGRGRGPVERVGYEP